MRCKLPTLTAGTKLLRRMAEACLDGRCCEDEDEVRNLLQGVLVSSLDAVELIGVLVARISVERRVLHTICLARLANAECHVPVGIQARTA